MIYFDGAMNDTQAFDFGIFYHGREIWVAGSYEYEMEKQECDTHRETQTWKELKVREIQIDSAVDVETDTEIEITEELEKRLIWEFEKN